ncbi:DHHW family protein [Paenibacillus sp. N3/727]|uniref:DHHW family protein n=1 Tax=Paenibacillus sp. N3/727 TaxID=2925845 RepID=UPI001F52CE12|nr:DHHW family protein [Paenibacillus sp. N3/727]UNK18400.1 DHHW family protein [Paenibacillus sp. N3/727]
MKQRADQLLVGGFVLTLFLMFLTFLLLPKEHFSELENRVLQSAPNLTWDNLLSKKYAEDAESFVTDQFPFRSKWLAVKSSVEQLRLQQENNGIYKGHSGYLFEKFVEPDYSKIQQYAESIKQFAISHPEANTTFMLAPTSVGIYADRLPWLAPNYPQSKVNQYIADYVRGSVSFMDGFEFLSPYASEPIYYRTDHHWTTNGAYLAYVAYAEKMGWHPLSKKEFHIQTVSNSFLGSYHTRSQFNGVTPDSIEVYKPIQPTSTEMYIADTGETLTNMYDASFLDKKDQYSHFLGGVHALMKFTSKLDPHVIKQEKLLVIKDSYAHNVIPFLTLHVPEIHVIDIRYYNGSISDYMSENGIKDVLLLFNTTTFIDNSALLKLDTKKK